GPGLGEPLCDGDTEGEAGVHQALGQPGHGPADALAEYLVLDALDERDAVVDGRRPLAVEQVRCVHGVPTGAQLLGERAHPVGQSLHVMEQHHFSHFRSLVLAPGPRTYPRTIVPNASPGEVRRWG